MGESHTKSKKQRGNQKRHGREENGYHVPANVFRTVIRTSIPNGLNVDELAENFRHIYSLLKA